MGILPEFYLEQGYSLPYGAGTPLFSHNLWKLPNVYPEIAGTHNQTIYDGWAFTPSGLASGIVRTYFWWRDNLAAEGVTLGKYSFRIDGIGARFPSNTNSVDLFNNQVDLQVGATGGGYQYNAYFAPWAPTGIAQMLEWATGFYPLLRSLFDASGIPYPDIYAVTTENFGDDIVGLDFVGGALGGTGWVDLALADPRSTGILFNGVETFADYWARVTGYYDGTLLPTGLVNYGLGYYAPQNQKIRDKWQYARLMGQAYALEEGIAKPYKAQFGETPTPAYLSFAGSPDYPMDWVYPGYPRWGPEEFAPNAMGPPFYAEYFHAQVATGVEGDISTYWDSPADWQRFYPLPEGYDGPFDASGYAAYRYGVDTLTQCFKGRPDKQVIPWLSIRNDLYGSGYQDVMLEVLKRCYDAGMRTFYCWESQGFRTSAEANSWHYVISALNEYALASSTNSVYIQSNVYHDIRPIGPSGTYLVSRPTGVSGEIPHTEWVYLPDFQTQDSFAITSATSNFDTVLAGTGFSTPIFYLGYNATANGATITTAGTGTYSLNDPYTAYAWIDSFPSGLPNTYRTFTITASGDYGTASTGIRIYFRQRQYWGVTTTGTYNSAFIESLASSGFTEVPSGILSFAATGSQYCFYSFRTAAGNTYFTHVGSNIKGGFTLVGSGVSYTNIGGYTENYNIFRSDNYGLGSVSFIVGTG